MIAVMRVCASNTLPIELLSNWIFQDLYIGL
jgi:hypothetical protein